VLFRKQSFANPDRLVNIYQNDRTGRPLVVTSYAAYKEIAEYPRRLRCDDGWQHS
jgi:hypothetical protein